METLFVLLAICSQRPVTRSFDVFFDLSLNERLSKQSGGWWLLWRQSNGVGENWPRYKGITPFNIFFIYYIIMWSFVQLKYYLASYILYHITPTTAIYDNISKHTLYHIIPQFASPFLSYHVCHHACYHIISMYYIISGITSYLILYSKDIYLTAYHIWQYIIVDKGHENVSIWWRHHGSSLTSQRISDVDVIVKMTIFIQFIPSLLYKRPSDQSPFHERFSIVIQIWCKICFSVTPL